MLSKNISLSEQLEILKAKEQGELIYFRQKGKGEYHFFDDECFDFVNFEYKTKTMLEAQAFKKGEKVILKSQINKREPLSIFEVVNINEFGLFELKGENDLCVRSDEIVPLNHPNLLFFFEVFNEKLEIWQVIFERKSFKDLKETKDFHFYTPLLAFGCVWK